MSERTLNVGLIGAGAMGRLHAEHIAHRVPRARLAAIADADHAAAAACGKRLGVPAIHDDCRSLLSIPGVDAVVICTPPETHAQVIQDAARAGKHIFCEKPLDCDLSAADAALAAVSAAGVKLMIGFNRRYDPSFRRVREGVAAGTIGTPQILRITSRDPLSGFSASRRDLFLDTTIHDFDMARYLVGSEVISLYVQATSNMAPGGAPDTALVSLAFANGALGAIDNSRASVYGYDQRVEVFGSGGALAAGNERLHHVVLSDAAGDLLAPPREFFVDRYVESYIAEMTAFVDYVVDGVEPLISPADAHAALVLALAARHSLTLNRPVSPAEVVRVA
jgi:myo-inositol 2-dehydrogenase/D-chiro-inositol 1-dehydrogenase